MQTECISGQLEFEGFDGRHVVAAFDGGAVTSDAGALLLRETDRAIRLIERLAACFSDGRDPGQLIHALPTLVGRFAFALCASLVALQGWPPAPQTRPCRCAGGRCRLRRGHRQYGRRRWLSATSSTI